jgi:tRNA(Ile)-lysidine synthase
MKSFGSIDTFGSNHTLLVGVSGGIDSVVLLDLLASSGFSIAVAHCNFHLRGVESDLDEVFVKSLANRYGVPFFAHAFDTRRIAESRGISLEMAARDLRYAWFEELRKGENFDWIVVAHHRDDQVETFFLNLARGTGIAGLTGMNVVNGRVVRPLLFASRLEVVAYASRKNLNYREDSSNSMTDFLRNKIRHLVIPQMEELNPSFRDRMVETISHLSDTSNIYYQAIDQARALVMRFNADGEAEISLAGLRLLQPMSAFLFEFLKPFQFNGTVVQEMIHALEGQPGKQFFSLTHRAVLDRGKILVQRIQEFSADGYYIEDGCERITLPLNLTFQSVGRTADFKLTSSQNMACIDRDRLHFPMILRRWQIGDNFQPLGMKGMKKLSDYFVDEKFSLPEKERTWLLTNGEEVVWIVGNRLDERYKVTDETKNLLIVTVD